METKFSGDQLAKIAEFRTHAGELADYLETIRSDAHCQETFSEVSFAADGNYCGTPQCALGHAVHQGLVPGAETKVLTDHRTDEGQAYPVYGVPYVNRYTVTPSTRPYRSRIAVYPVRNGECYDWADIGREHYGPVVHASIFMNTERSLEETINALREYAASGESGMYAHDPVEFNTFTYVDQSGE